MMRVDDVPEWFADAMVLLAEAYPSFRLREGTVRVYAGVLGGYDREQVMAAIGRAPREYPNFFPAAGELLVLIEPKPEDAGLLAWMGLAQAAADVGAYASLTCEDGAAASALLAVFGSWARFCEECVDGVSGPWLAKRQEFLAAYRSARRERTGPRRLSGLCGQETPGVWVGRLTLGGHVLHERAALPATAEPKRLTEGEP